MKSLLFAALTACLALTPAPAQTERWQLPSQKPLTQPVSLRGKLIHDWELSDHWGGPLKSAAYCPPVEVWKLDTGSGVYRLYFDDLVNSPKTREAARLVGKTVRVEGRLLSPGHVRVLTLEAEEYVRKTVKVEARGTLHAHPSPADPHITNARGSWPVVMHWTLEAGGRTFTIACDFMEATNLQGFDGKAAVVTGTLDGEGRLRVGSVRADDGEVGDAADGLGRSEVRGVLTRRYVPLVEDGDDSREPRLYALVYEVKAAGKTFRLKLERRHRDEAAALDGRTVVVFGRHDKGGIVVESLRADAGQVKETVQVEIRGTLYRDSWSGVEGVGGPWQVRRHHWFLSADTDTYFVRFARPDLAALAASCDGRLVTVTAVLTPTPEGAGPAAGCAGGVTIQTLRMD
jgi:hypothetical protein